ADPRVVSVRRDARLVSGSSGVILRVVTLGDGAVGLAGDALAPGTGVAVVGRALLAEFRGAFAVCGVRAAAGLDPLLASRDHFRARPAPALQGRVFLGREALARRRQVLVPLGAAAG